MGILNWFKSISRDSLIKNSFLFPILLVVIMSISHVVSWYDIGNPWAWAIYLSVAVEIFALASVSAASISIGRGSVWFLFLLVTAIQIIGNIFFEFTDMDEKGKLFLSWVELVKPFFDDWSLTDHRRLLSILQGGTIPIMSLIALNYYIKFGDKLKEQESKVSWTKPLPNEPISVRSPFVKPTVESEPEIIIPEVQAIPEPEIIPEVPLVKEQPEMKKIIESIVDIPEKDEPTKINRIDDEGIAPYASVQ